ncbi:hypothetical protein IMSHALPRED_006168 [Imshaugia aleurites]|uniref:Uncharacterized protein n=1 Tax=Imshaugia aleurites TaxID=172621 RepID=A0A8H3FJ34_9LECA|nr:hypothetical protein IMSHALPRED_006168 [Imshaugia aleurites]
MDNQQNQAFRPKTDYTTDDPKSQTSQAREESSAGGLGGIGDKLSSVAGGSTEGSGDSQSLFDKGISYLQQSVTGQKGQTNETEAKGDTSHHAAVDEAHPEKISEFLRDQNRSTTEEEK